MDSPAQLCYFVKSYVFRSRHAIIKRRVEKCSMQDIVFYVRSHSVAVFLFYKKNCKIAYGR